MGTKRAYSEVASEREGDCSMLADIRPAMGRSLPRAVAMRARRDRLLCALATTAAAFSALVAVMLVTAMTLTLGLS